MGILRVCAMSLIITCWEVQPCWGATLTIHTPDAQVNAIVDWLCARNGKWPFWADIDSCAQGRPAVVAAVSNSIVAWVRNRSGLALDATVELTYDNPP